MLSGSLAPSFPDEAVQHTALAGLMTNSDPRDQSKPDRDPCQYLSKPSVQHFSRPDISVHSRELCPIICAKALAAAYLLQFWCLEGRGLEAPEQHVASGLHEASMKRESLLSRGTPESILPLAPLQ